MNYKKRDYWYATLRQIKAGSLAIILRYNKNDNAGTHRYPLFGLRFHVTASIGRRDLVIANRNQHEIL